MESEKETGRMFVEVEDDYGFDIPKDEEPKKDLSPGEEKRGGKGVSDESRVQSQPENPRGGKSSPEPSRKESRRKTPIVLKGDSNGIVPVTRRDCHLLFSADVFLFAKMVCASRGISISKYVESLVSADIKRNQAFFDKYVRDFAEESGR